MNEVSEGAILSIACLELFLSLDVLPRSRLHGSVLLRGRVLMTGVGLGPEHCWTRVSPTRPFRLPIIRSASLHYSPAVSLLKVLQPSVLSRYQLIDRFSDRLFPLQRACFFALRCWRLGGERRPQQRVSEMITSALKFRRGGVSDPAHLLTVEVSCRLSHLAARDDGCGSRICWIHSHRTPETARHFPKGG